MSSMSISSSHVGFSVSASSTTYKSSHKQISLITDFFTNVIDTMVQLRHLRIVPCGIPIGVKIKMGEGYTAFG